MASILWGILITLALLLELHPARALPSQPDIPSIIEAVPKQHECPGRIIYDKYGNKRCEVIRRMYET